MTSAVYLLSLEPNSGKSLISLGLLEMAAAHVDRIGYFRPVIASGEQADGMIELARQRYRLTQEYEESYGITTEQTRDMGESVPSELVHTILGRYDALAARCDLVIVEGTDFSGASSAFEFALNSDIASNLGATTVIVGRAHRHRADQISGALRAAVSSLHERHVPVAGLVVNRIKESLWPQLQHLSEAGVDGLPVWLVPDDASLTQPTLRDIAAATSAELIIGQDADLNRVVENTKVAAMTLPHFLERLQPGSLVVVPGDRADVFTAAAASGRSTGSATVAGLLLTGGLLPEEVVLQFAEQMAGPTIPVLSVDDDTFEAATVVAEVKGSIRSGDERRVASALRLFDDYVDSERLWEAVSASRSEVVTPLMFERQLAAQAKANKRTIVLPEGEDDRVLQAADLLLRRAVVDLVVLGDLDHIREREEALGLDLSSAELIDPRVSPLREEFAGKLLELRKHKGMTADVAHDQVADVSWFGTMLVQTGRVDGMVSGAAHTTADTVRPALQIIRTSPEVSVVSSVFLMALPDKVLVYGDCAVVPDPDAVQLADIAISSAETARSFGIDPYVALLSYSTGSSGTGAEVEKVKQATALVKQRRPDLPVEGPIQYDAAVEPSVAKSKLPGSPVAGRATVLVFPDLNTGNNTYKAVQRSAGALAIGPVLQGLRLPVNDLSRGALVDDIVNTVIITSLQASATGNTQS